MERGDLHEVIGVRLTALVLDHANPPIGQPDDTICPRGEDE